MYTSKIKKNITGFSLAEIVIVLAIVTVLISIIVPSFKNVGGGEALNTSIVSVISILNDAKSQAISSKDASDYGVRIFNDKLVSFKNSYGTDNKETTISGLVTISTSTDLGADIIFSNVSGVTSASGTITITVISEPSKSGTIRVYPTGLIEKN